MKIFSPAKINLTLDVFAKKRNQSFHHIDTIFHRVNWGDTLELIGSSDFSIEGNFAFPVKQNTIYKAYQCIQKTIPHAPPIRVKVLKNIPQGSGLGGGSSNAVSFVKGYFEYFQLGQIPQELKHRIKDLGKDIAFFLSEFSCARGTNFGEKITPCDFNFSGAPVFLYFSSFPMITKEAYQRIQNFDTDFTKKFLKTLSLNDCGNAFMSLYSQHNSELKLTGSGSAFFSFTSQNISDYQRVETILC